MKFLVDNNLSPRLAYALVNLGHEAQHVRELGMAAATDLAITDHAAMEDLVVVSQDNDFPELIALGGLGKPSVVMFDDTISTDPNAQAVFLNNVLPRFKADLEIGEIVVLSRRGARVRRIPLGSEDT